MSASVEMKVGGHDSRKSEIPPPQPEADVQDLLKYEYNKLHKEFRLLENNRHGFAQREGGMRTRVNHLIPLLDKDRKDLRCELRIATSAFHSKQADNYTIIMREVLKTYEAFREEIAKKIKQIEEIERHVDKITDKVVKQRYMTMATFGPSTSMAHRERKLMIAEDKLYSLTCACNLQTHANKKVRDEINDLLMERSQFFREHRLLKRQLAKTRNKMLKIVQLAIQTYDTRDEAVAKLKSLREREAKESKQFGLELQEFERNFHHYKEVLTFIRIKTRQREVYERAKDKRLRLGNMKEKELDSILRRYRLSFKRILAYSNSQSIIQLVEHFKKLDVSNFEAFKYVTNVNSECEVLREAVEILKGQIEDAHAEVEERKETQREAQEKLQLAIISHQEHLSQLQAQSAKNAQRFKEMVALLKKATKVAECDNGPIFAMLGSKGQIGRNNLCLCLAQLDFTITELKHEHDLLLDLKNNFSASVQAFKNADYQKPKSGHSYGGPYQPKIHMFNVDSIEEEDNRIMEEEPYYYKEMREFVFLKMLEDRVIDPSTRYVSERISADLNPQASSTKHNSRRSLMDKIQATGRRTRHTAYMQDYMSASTHRSNFKSKAGIFLMDSDHDDAEEAQSGEVHYYYGEEEEEEHGHEQGSQHHYGGTGSATPSRDAVGGTSSQILGGTSSGTPSRDGETSRQRLN